jgi:glucose-6-phosphate 1-dehydrogenase
MKKPTILVVIGITGDLSRRKLLPAIEQLVHAKAAPDKFEIVGISRRVVTAEEVLKDEPDKIKHGFLKDHLKMFQMDLTEAADYERLKGYLAKIEKDFGTDAQALFYLSVPPQVSEPIIRLLGESGLANKNSKLLLEKPFGTDLGSARALIEQTRQCFTEEQIYRIDHYLAKDMAQNLVVFRGGNSLFKRTWDNNFIECIEIIAAEKIDIEGRVTFYEQTGAMRDVVQSHLLQLAALTLMDVPTPGNLQDVPKRRLEALKHVEIPDKPIAEIARRGQYKGYSQEVENPGSSVETYASLTLQSTDPRWANVPITLITGKALKEKLTQIRITYKKDQDYESNELVIKFQPDEGIELSLWTKVPGYEWRVERHSLRLKFSEQFGMLTEAYEQVLLDAINSNHAFFTSSDEVLESWRVLEPIQKAWSMSADDLVLYDPGSEAGF